MRSIWFLKKFLGQKKKMNFTDRLLFGILGLGLALILVFFGYLLWFTLSNRSVVYFLPAQKTVAYFELEDLSLPSRLKSETLFENQGIEFFLDKTFGLSARDLKKNFSLQGRSGLALIQDGDGQAWPVLFFRSESKAKTLDYFKKTGLSDEELTILGEKKALIYAYSQGRELAFTFAGPYVFIARQSDPLKFIQESYQQKNAALNTSADYQKSLGNLPRSAWGYGYINFQTVSLQAFPDLQQILSPLREIIRHLAFTLRKEPGGFHFNTLLSFQGNRLALEKDSPDTDKRFSYHLADYLGSKNLAVYLGGENLSQEWESTLKTLSRLNPAYGIILEGILKNQVNRFFGDEIDLRNDIYPLFEGEYALALENLPEGEDEEGAKELGIKLILTHSDRAFTETKLKKLLEGFQLLGAQFVPQLKVIVLPDGTESRELVADPSRLREVDEEYKSYRVHCLDIPDSPYGFCYAATDNLLIMTTNLSSLKETLDLSFAPHFNLSQSQTFRQTLSRLSAVSDEITFIAGGPLGEILESSAWIAPFSLLNSLEAVTWVKHYFSDGVSAEGYWMIK